MTKQVTEYLIYIRAFMREEHSSEEFRTERELLLKRIEFYQHERLIHLLVTLGFAVFFLLSLMMYFMVKQAAVLVLSVLFLVLLIPYIKHYYFLENSVQELYTVYYTMTANV